MHKPRTSLLNNLCTLHTFSLLLLYWPFHCIKFSSRARAAFSLLRKPVTARCTSFRSSALETWRPAHFLFYLNAEASLLGSALPTPKHVTFFPITHSTWKRWKSFLLRRQRVLLAICRTLPRCCVIVAPYPDTGWQPSYLVIDFVTVLTSAQAFLPEMN